MTKELDDIKWFSIIVHDLKTPVSAAKGFLDLVENIGPVNDDQVRYLGRAGAALTRMEQMINSLLDYVQLGAGLELERYACDLAKLARESVNYLTDVADQRSITLHAPDAEAEVVVMADERLMTHVFNNLISNAVKYNREQGDVWVKVERLETVVRCAVRDSGMGISAEAQDRIFKRNVRAVDDDSGERPDGNGLGLAISRQIVEMHGGRIWVESISDVGSEFIFEIPVQAGDGDAASTDSSKNV